MATWLGTKMAAGVQPRFLPDAGGVRVLSTYAFPASGQPATNDLINMMAVPVETSNPNGPAIMGVTFDSDQVDTGAAILYDVGDTNSGGAANNTRFFSSSNIGQAGGFAIPSSPAILGLTYTAQTTIFIKIHTQSATPKAGTVRLAVEYSYDP